MPNLPAEKISGSLGRFQSILTEDEIERIIALQEQPLPSGIRMNPLMGDPQTTLKDLSARYGWVLEPVKFYELGWRMHSAIQPPGTTIEHRMGRYYIQDVASMIPVSLFELQNASPLILDMAASPGGKTTHLIDRTRDRGFVLANDASKSRISALRSVLAAWSGINQVITRFPGESFGDWFPELFEAVLLDAPCSMENLRPIHNRPLRDTTQDERIRLKERQTQLLISGLRALKPGGQLVYATCSLAPEENEAVIDAVLSTFPLTLQLENVASRFTFPTAGLSQFEGNRYHASLKNCLRLWPHLSGMSGFFCALITKIDSLPDSEYVHAPSRDFNKTGLRPINALHQSIISGQLSEGFGFNLESTINDYNLEVFLRNDLLFLIPQAYLHHFKSLPFEYIGLPLGKWFENQFQPSHEFVSRFGHDFTAGKIALNEDSLPQWIAGRDIRNPETELRSQGQFLLVSDTAGRNLGMGKLLPGRLRNLLPRRSV